MSDFDLAINTVLKHEGLYGNDPSDPGGATSFGISLRWLKSLGDANLDGFLDGDLDHNGSVDIQDIKKMSVIDATRFYKKWWWDKYQYDLIKNQDIAIKVFDTTVNMGSKQSHLLLQRALWSIYGYKSLDDDGVLGSKSLSLINVLGTPQYLLSAYRCEIACFYQYLVKAKPELAKFQNGWMKRAYS